MTNRFSFGQTGSFATYQGYQEIRKILVSVKFFARNSGAGNGRANFMAPGKNAFFLQEKTHAHKIPRFGGGYFGFGAGKCRFYFYGHEDFSEERPPGLIEHVLTVLVFLSWVLLQPRLPPSSRSLRLFPCASILLHAPLDICLDLLPAAPLPPVQKQDAQHKFLQQRGARAECKQWFPKR